MNNLDGRNNFRAEKRQPYPCQGNSGTLSHKVTPLVSTLREIGSKKLENNQMNPKKKLNVRAQSAKEGADRVELRTQPDNAETPRLQMVVPLALTSRQIENKKLIDDHMNINKKLNSRAQVAKKAAENTRSRLQQARLVRQTETSRPRREVTPDNVRYLESVDGVGYRKEMKIEQEAKMQAAWMVSDPQLFFS